MTAISQLQQLLADAEIEEIWVNSPTEIFIARRGVSQRVELECSAAEIQLWVEKLLMHSQRRLDLSQPFVDATLTDGSRLHVAIPHVTAEHWAINIRKFIKRIGTLDQLVGLNVMDASTALLLEGAVVNGYNIVVAGGTGTGKTTLLNCLLKAVPESERIITCEEVFELSVSHLDHVALQTRPPSLEGTGEITVRELVRQSLRMRPERLVVGEVRGAESLDLLLALNSGQPGLATIHANSASEAVLKLCTLPLLAGDNVTAQFVTPTVAAAVDVIVHVERTPQGIRQVSEVIGLTGAVGTHVPIAVPLVTRSTQGWNHHHGPLPKSTVRRRTVDAQALWQAA
jgi:pilus assembly protein CpaF